jgi:hypothetical protein
MMEAARTSETLVNFYQTTRRYNPEDSHLRKIVVITNHEVVCNGGAAFKSSYEILAMDKTYRFHVPKFEPMKR